MASISRILKSTVLAIFFLTVFLLSGCLKNPMKCPYDYPGSVWESDSPYIVLYINENGVFDEESPDPNGQAFLKIDGELKQVLFCAEPITICAPIYDYEMCKEAGALIPEALLLDTECHYYEDKIVMKIIEDHVYEGEYKEVILERIK